MALTSDRKAIRQIDNVLTFFEGAFGAVLRLAKTQAEALAALGLTLPLPVAQGGTGNTGGAWTAYTPTMTANVSGVSGNVSGAYRLVGKALQLRMEWGVTYTGTTPTQLTLSLPPGLTLKGIQAGSAANVSASLCLGCSGNGGASALSVFPSTTTMATASGQFFGLNFSGEIA